MMKKVSVALVISTYNWPQALRLVLQSVLEQEVLPDEIIIADDGSGQPTRSLIESFKKKFPVPLKHFWHDDDGFRKTVILNQAIAGTNCDYIIEVDGDIVLHKRFIKDHLRVAERGHYIRGSRLMLSENKSNRAMLEGRLAGVTAFSAGVKNRFNGLRIPMLAPLLIKKSDRSRNFRGCNCAFWRADFIKVNGYNNEMNGWGHEDIELAARFINAGVMQKKVKMMAICYHLHHTILDRGQEDVNFTIYTRTIKQGIRYCSKGYNSYQKQYS